MSHSPEPWSISHITEDVTAIVSCDKIIVRVKDGAIYGGQGRDAERIVACVNACRGIPTEHLQAICNEVANGPPIAVLCNRMGWE